MSIRKRRPSFDPFQLFARGRRGAWLEPRSGYMWQENTGVTPTTTGGQTVGKLVDLTAARVASQSTAANRPIYQLDSKSLPYLSHGATGSLSVALPAINARRNLLTYSEQFDNAAWNSVSGISVSRSEILGPSNQLNTYKATSTSTLGYYGQNAGGVGVPYTNSFYVKFGNCRWVMLNFGSLGATACWFDVQNGVVGTQAAGYTGTITPAANGWYRCSVTGVKPTAPLYILPCVTGDGATSSVVGTFTYIAEAQLDLGSDTAYQKITDWTSEQYSSSGSVYFGVPQGMSALHNQSIGTAYTLPAVNSAIYGWCVFPERLTRPEEAQLERYFLRLAGISGGPDYLLDDNDQQLTDDAGELLLRA